MTRLAAFVFSELAETSATLAGLGEARSSRSRRAYLDVVHSAVAPAGGRELTADADAILAEFDSTTAAVAFAASVQRGCERESRNSSERLDVRVGIVVGEIDADGDAGVAAVRAKQLARAAEAGNVLASNVVAALAPGPAGRPATRVFSPTTPAAPF